LGQFITIEYSNFNSWNRAISDAWDKTVNPNNNFTYNHIIISSDVDNNFIYVRAMNDMTSDQSDH